MNEMVKFFYGNLTQSFEIGGGYMKKIPWVSILTVILGFCQGWLWGKYLGWGGVFPTIIIGFTLGWLGATIDRSIQ